MSSERPAREIGDMSASELSTSRDSTIGLSVVVPVFRGAALVAPLIAAIQTQLVGLAYPYEIVLVDDGSPDESWAAILTAVSRTDQVRGIKLSRNFGQQIAVSAGIAHARGRRVIVMDGDLQNPPSAIPEIISRLDAGIDIVYTVSRGRNNATDAATSRLFWFVLTRVLRVNMVKGQLMMRGMSARFAKAYLAYPERTRTVAGITGDMGFPYAVLEVENAARPEGKSNYNFFKRFDLMVDIIISITAAPLKILIYVSLFTLIVTMVSSIYYIVYSLLFSVVSGFTSIMLAIFFFGSLITLILGIIGVYIANIYTEVRRRPLYIVEQEI